MVESGRAYFDTNTTNHHHFFHEDSRVLEDIAGDDVEFSRLPVAPGGTQVSRVDVVVRLRKQECGLP